MSNHLIISTEAKLIQVWFPLKKKKSDVTYSISIQWIGFYSWVPELKSNRRGIFNRVENDTVAHWFFVWLLGCWVRAHKCIPGKCTRECMEPMGIARGMLPGMTCSSENPLIFPPWHFNRVHNSKLIVPSHFLLATPFGHSDWFYLLFRNTMWLYQSSYIVESCSGDSKVRSTPSRKCCMARG